MKESKLIGISESIGRRMEWKSSNGDMIRSDLCGCIRATDYKIPKNVWLEDDGNRTIHTDHTGDQLIKRFFDMADQNAIELPSELKGKKFRIRKLTPRECFRLMGVDDKDIDKIQAAGISQSGQYKLAGNSIVVDVLFHIFRKMFIETDQDFDGTPTQLTLF